MARRAAGPTGPLHSAQDGAPGGRAGEEQAGGGQAGGEHAAAHRRDDGAEDLARLRETLLHGRSGPTGSAGHAGPPLRVEDPVHPPLGAEVGADPTWPDADPDALAAGESTLMHPDDLAALHDLPTTGTEADLWVGPWADPQQGGPWESDGRDHRLVAAADGLSLWDDPWDDGGAPGPDGHGRTAAGAPPPGAALLGRRWVQLVACALVCLVVGAAAALLVTARQVDAARAEADRQREVATSARADLARERTARAAERASSADAPAPPLAVPSPDPQALPESPAASGDPSAPSLPTDVERPPVAEAPAPTADPGPPPPGPSPSPGPGGASRATSGSSSVPGSGDAASSGPSLDSSSGQPADQQPGAQGSAAQDDDAAPGQQCPPSAAGSPAAGGDGPTTCP